MWEEPRIISEVTWALRDDTWVPKTFKIQTRSGRVQLTYDLSFEWESVNKPVAARWFTLEGLGLKEVDIRR